MLDSPKDERSEKDQKHKKQLEEMNNDLLALLRSMDHLGVKLFMLKTEENPSSEGSGSSRFENQQEDQYDDQVDEDSHLIFDDSDGEDDARACFPCPFCYVDIDLPMLCNHLQEDHCFDLKNAVCPLCAANLGKDVIGHFIVQHASSLKRRKKSGKSGLTGNSAMLGKRFPTNAVGNKHESAPDPLLSLFINNMQFLDPKCIQQDESFRDDASDTSAVKSMEPSSLDEGHEQDNEERRQKAAFVQQLIMSTIF